MATIIGGSRRPFSRATAIYLAVVLAAFVIVAAGASMWLSTDNSGTNSLASDEKAMSRAP
jgi:hypothetical protein